MSSLRQSTKVRLALRIWRSYLKVRSRLRRESLPSLVSALSCSGSHAPYGLPPVRLAAAVNRALQLGTRRPSCLVSALVLYHLLREEGEPAELVIGLPNEPLDQAAHAWVELRGVDVGPPPGCARHRPIARFGAGSAAEATSRQT